MRPTEELRADIEAGVYDGSFAYLYPGVPLEQVRRRYAVAVAHFEALFGGKRKATLVSAPGRTEVCGNHTDHQRGRVLAAAVNLDVICVAAAVEDKVVHIRSEGFPEDYIDLRDLSVQEEEKNSSSAIIRGIASWFVESGYKVGGVEAYTTSEVLGGSGLSSSAAFETAVGNIFNHLYNSGAVDAPSIAMAGQYAENKYFGKPSGLMDQMASSVGGLVMIDFADPPQPEIRPVRFDFAHCGHKLCIVDTKGSHANLTPDYAAIPREMGAVAAFFGKKYLREVREEDFIARVAEIRAKTGDRAVLRAMHYFSDDKRVPMEVEALENGNFSEFLRLVVASGESSFTCLQNVFSTANPHEQGLPLALAVSRRVLAGTGGAWRVHGGGFAGTIQAFVPDSALGAYRAALEAVFGNGACHVLSIRPAGGVKVVPGMGV